jgi:hypothetical protein
MPPAHHDEPPVLEPGDRGAAPFATRAREPAAVILAGAVLRWIIPAVAKFPKTLRYGLGARIEGALTDVLEGLVVAQYATGSHRTGALQHANARLQVARHLACGWPGRCGRSRSGRWCTSRS